MSCDSFLTIMGKPDIRFTSGRPKRADRARDPETLVLYNTVLEFYKKWDGPLMHENCVWRFVNAGTHTHTHAFIRITA
jgi:hypothetical protein